jgi:hypothetical protein
MSGYDWFTVGAKLCRPYAALPETVKCVALRPVADTFVRNADRLGSLMALPINLTFQSFLVGKDAVLRSQGSAEQSQNTHQDDNNKQYHNDMQQHSGCILDAMIIKGGRYIAPGLDALSSSAVIICWTAFESLAADLWVEAINYSLHLAEEVLNRQQPPRRGDSSDSRAQEKSIHLHKLAKYGYDLRNKMGFLLRDEKKVQFDQLSYLKAAYKDAFGERSEELFLRYQDLSLIEALRNLFAHRGGIIDENFLKRTKKRKEFGDLSKGAELHLNRSMLQSLVDTTIKCCIELVGLVDGEVMISEGRHGGDRQGNS